MYDFTVKESLMGKYFGSISTEKQAKILNQAVLKNIERPRLKVVFTKQFLLFIRIRASFAKQGAEKNKEPRDQISTISYKHSIDDADMQVWFDAGWVDVVPVESITKAEGMY